MAEDELAARRRAKQGQNTSEGAPADEGVPDTTNLTIEEIGWEMSLAFLTSQRAVALEEPEVKLELLWRDVERWTEAYVRAIRTRRDAGH